MAYDTMLFSACQGWTASLLQLCFGEKFEFKLLARIVRNMCWTHKTLEVQNCCDWYGEYGHLNHWEKLQFHWRLNSSSVELNESRTGFFVLVFVPLVLDGYLVRWSLHEYTSITTQAQGIPMIPVIPTIDYLNTADPTLFFTSLLPLFMAKVPRLFNFLSF